MPKTLTGTSLEVQRFGYNGKKISLQYDAFALKSGGSEMMAGKVRTRLAGVVTHTSPVFGTF